MAPDFDPVNYRRNNPEIGGLSDVAAGMHYLSIGKAAGLSYAMGQPLDFDPEHFRETHPAFACADDADCRTAWVEQGGADTAPGTQVEHLRRLGLALQEYPTAFPWRFYTRLYPRAAAHRWAALAHFLAEGSADVGDQLPYGADAAPFLVAVGDLFTLRGHHAMAVNAYELATASGGASTKIHRMQLAHAYGRVGAWTPALNLYEGVLADGTPNADVLRGYVNAVAMRNAWPRLFARLPQALSKIEHGRDALTRDLTETYFHQRCRAARTLYLDRRRAEGDGVLADAVRIVANLAEACLPVGPRTRAERPLVAILADGLSKATSRRLEHHVLHLGGIGYEVRVFGLSAVRAFEEALPAAEAAILIRMPAWPTVVQALVRAKLLGVPTLYETDELTIDPRFAPPPLTAFEGRIGERAYEDLIFGVALHRAAAALCDFGLAPNRTLADRLDDLVETGRSFVLRDVAAPKEQAGPRPASTGTHVRLFLHVARTRTVRATDAVGAALLDILLRHPGIVLVTAGFVELDEAFAPFADRIDARSPEASWDEALRDCDLNLVPAELWADAGEAADCLAVTGWLAAARFAIPTLASRTRAYREALDDGIDVRLASGEAEWSSALSSLVADSNLRRDLGRAAERRAASTYSDAAAMQDCRAMMAQIRTSRSP